MAIDIRATVTCSLGTLISGSISDDYLQGSGLVKTRGSCEISALITPAVGTVVTFDYVKGGVTRTLPRRLRVLSSFADPFRRTTKVELGCKLTYLSDLQEPVKWDAFDDPENASYDTDDQRIVTLPIHASSVMTKCLTELGITASSSPLTNKFSIAEFDFGGGYVQVLGDLLVSESYFGYLDTSEVLQVASLDQEGGTGPVYTGADIVDLGPIGTGPLPGEAVTVSYSTLKLKDPQDDAGFILRTLWEEEEEASEIAYYYIAFDGGTAVYAGRDVTTTTTTYKKVPANEQIAGNYYLVTGDTKDVVDRRETEVKSPDVKGLGQLASAKLSNGGSFPATERIASKVITTYEYDPTGELVRTTTLEYEDQAFAAYRLPIPLIFDSSFVEIGSGLKLVSRTVNSDEKYGSYTKRVTSRYVWWPFSQVGQQAVAEARETFTSVAAVESYVSELLGAGLVHDGTQITSNRVGLSSYEGRPSSAELTNGAYAKDGDPNNGWRTESQADLELALGSATAQRRIEFSMPYAPDDIFSGPSGGPFTATASDAPAKANRYGRVQNRLLLGNRSGVNLQLAPERLPAAPFTPLYLQADGLTALYRANGNQWAFDSNGIVCSTDALFWAAVGGTGTFWFPVAPGITTLPAEPAIVDGTMNATNVVLPYNETAIYESRIRLGNVVTKFEYALELLTVVPALSIKTQITVSKVIVADAGAYELNGQSASFLIGRVLNGGTGSFVFSGQEALFFPPVLIAETGAYVLSGQQAGLLKELFIRTGTQAPLLGAAGATSSTGWTLIQNANEDDAFVQTATWPFTFTLNSVGYTSTYVGSNTYLTFGAGSTEYSLSVSNPNLPKLMFGASDNSYQRVYTKSEIASDGSDIFRIRYEGASNSSGQPIGFPNIVVEIALYSARTNGDQWIELRVGDHNDPSGLFNIANETTAYVTGSITANSSWVFVGNSTGTSWTLTSNRYVD
jgi:hypothetical protein